MLINKDTTAEDLKNTTMALIEEGLIPRMNFIVPNGNRNKKDNNVDSMKMFLDMATNGKNNTFDESLICNNNQKVLKRTPTPTKNAR